MNERLDYLEFLKKHLNIRPTIFLWQQRNDLGELLTQNLIISRNILRVFYSIENNPTKKYETQYICEKDGFFPNSALIKIPSFINYYQENLKQIYSRIQAFANGIVVCFSQAQNKSDANYFGSIVFPSIFGNFVINELLDKAYTLLDTVLDESKFSTSEDSIAGYMFSAFFNGFPQFLNSFFSEFFKLVNERKSSFHHGTLLSILNECFEFSCRYLTVQHLRILEKANSNSPKFFTIFFMKKVIETNLLIYLDSDFSNYCPIGRNVILKNFHIFTNLALDDFIGKINSGFINKMMKQNTFYRTLPSISTQFSIHKFSFISSGYEQRLIFQIFKHIPDWPIKYRDYLIFDDDTMKPFFLEFYPPELRESIQKNSVGGFVSDLIHYPTEINEDMKKSYSSFYKSLNDTNRQKMLLTSTGPIFDYFEHKEIKKYEDAALLVENYISMKIHTTTLDVLQSIFSERLHLLLCNMTSSITRSISFINANSFEDKIICYYNNFPSSLLKPYFIFNLVEEVQKLQIFSELVHEKQLIFIFTQLFISMGSDTEKYNIIAGKRGKAVVSLIESLARIDTYSFGNGIFILAVIISKIEQILNSLNLLNQTNAANLFLYAYLKSGSKAVLPILLVFKYLNFNNTLYQETMKNYNKQIPHAFDVIKMAIVDIFLKDKNDLRHLILHFISNTNAKKG